MQVVHWGRARKFIQKNQQAETPLKDWRRAVQNVQWKNFADIRSTFSDADWVEGLVVFNIKGNDYRLIVIAGFENQRLYVKHILTHAEYNLNKWKPGQKKRR